MRGENDSLTEPRIEFDTRLWDELWDLLLAPLDEGSTQSIAAQSTGAKETEDTLQLPNKGRTSIGEGYRRDEQ